MADPTVVNPQITDSAAQAHSLTAGCAAAMATGLALQAMGHAAGIAMMNAVQTAREWSIANQAATVIAANDVLLAGAGVPEPPGSILTAKVEGL